MSLLSCATAFFPLSIGACNSNHDDLLTVTQNVPAALYMYTTNSQFNDQQMTQYMIDGKIIVPPDMEADGLGSGFNNSLPMSNGTGAEFITLPVEDFVIDNSTLSDQ